MSEFVVAAGGAFWFGVLTAISPCLMATNVAAITFIARKVNQPKHALISGIFYAAGQALAYVLLGMLLVSSLMSVPLVSQWLQKYMLRLLGPIIIIAAMFLLELLNVRPGRGRMKQGIQKHTESGGFWAAALLGIVFGMSFCPTTAALFFGGLIPLAVEFESRILLPLMYSIGVALPVLSFGVLIAYSANRVGRVFERVERVERWARTVTGTIFLLIGIYFTLAFTIDVI